MIGRATSAKRHSVELTSEHVEGYLALMAPGDAPALRQQRAARVRERLAAGKLSGADIRIALDAEGSVCAALGVGAASPSLIQLYRVQLRSSSEQDRRAAATLVPEALERARALGATHVLARINEADSFVEYEAALQAAGFAPSGRRIEYRGKLADLPSEGASPFTWSSLAHVPRPRVLRLLDEILLDDPTFGFQGSAEDTLRETLSVPDLTGGDDCVHLGSLEGRDAALVIAQVQPSTGWATITQMGLGKEFRGRGLGALVQRHGFDMLRALGGVDYRDGTSLDNLPMRRIFEKHGCTELARMTDWTVTLGRDDEQPRVSHGP